MPYNVICLACTVVAIAFGSIHNLTTRRFTVLDPTKKKGLKTKIKEFIAKLRGKKEVKVEEIKEETKDENKSNNSAVGGESEDITENESEGEQSDDSEIQFNFKDKKTKPRRRWVLESVIEMLKLLLFPISHAHLKWKQHSRLGVW